MYITKQEKILGGGGEAVPTNTNQNCDHVFQPHYINNYINSISSMHQLNGKHLIANLISNADPLSSA